MATLITGGAGYIGSVVVEDMLAKGSEVVVLDNLSRGHRGAVAPARLPRRRAIHPGTNGDPARLRPLLERHKFC